MAGRPRNSDKEHAATGLEVAHLRREARTALELSVVALAPWRVIERLSTATGLLEALAELPSNSPPALALVPKVLTIAKEALEDWRKWEKANLERRLARG